LRGRINSWEELHTAVCERFDRDQYQHHLRQLDNLRQSGSVAEYHAKFEQLVHSTLLYNDSYDDVYLVTHFLGGLKEEIRAPIALHRPKNVDTASPWLCCRKRSLSSARTMWVRGLTTERQISQAVRFSLLWTMASRCIRKMI